MCYMLMIGIEEKSAGLLAPGPPSEISAAPITSPSLAPYLTPQQRCYFVGGYGHCSCGWVLGVRNNRDGANMFQLNSEVRGLLVEAANAAGRLCFVAHWGHLEFDEDQFPMSVGSSMDSGALKASDRLFRLDEIVWVMKEN
jgi:hypothetical protein